MLGKTQTQRAKKAIRERITALNRAWTRADTRALEGLFHENMVMVMPGFSGEVSGSQACIESYLEFYRNTDILKFEEIDISIEVWGDTSVVYYDFEIEYAQAGERFVESGHDVLVFNYTLGEWRVVWRTLLGDALAQGE